jgi:hypothetical protein
MNFPASNMKFARMIAAALTVILCVFSTSPGAAEEKPNPAHVFEIPGQTEALLESYCYSCHDGEMQKGDIRLDNLGELDASKRLDLLNRVQEQVYFKHMPPKGKRQPSEDERQSILAMLSSELRVHGASTLEGKLQKPEFGNYVDHEQLFSGEFNHLPGFTHDRRWLISEYIFNAKFERLLEHTTRGTRQQQGVTVLGGNRIQNLSLANPFLLPNVSGVRYYANEDMTGGHLSSMLTNAQKTSEYITEYLVKRNKKYLPAINQIMGLEDGHQATLLARRAVFEADIERLCDEIYGDDNTSLLPTFQPVELKALEELPDGQTYKKAPIHVAQKMLNSLEGDTLVYEVLLNPERAKHSDDEIRELCERTWFYRGDHVRAIQGRMALLREYLPEFREIALKEGHKIKVKKNAPLEDAEMDVIRTAIKKHRAPGDHYREIIAKCMTEWEQQFEKERMDAGLPSDEVLIELITQISRQILERPPEPSEMQEYLELSKAYITSLGRRKAIQKLIQTFILTTEFVYRQEFGSGPADEHGRKMLSPRDTSYAIAYALTDQSPDDELKQAAESGRLSSRADYEREIRRILKARDKHYLIDPVLADKSYKGNTTNVAIRKLRFFREFFGYPAAITIFKDEKRFGLDRLDDATARLLNETDQIVEYILENDKQVFEELLTTENFYVYHDGDNERMQAASDRIKRIYAYFKELDWKNFKKEDLVTHADFLRDVKMRGVNPDNLEAKNRQGDTLQLFKMSMGSITARLDKGQKEAAPFDLYRGYGYDFMPAYNVANFFNIDLNNWDYQTAQPAKVANRKGLLTHPAWLIAHATNTETDPIHRGKWVREKLLAGTIPDVPITVDAVIPEDHTKTLRDRLVNVTETPSCWNCHERMNPLGYTFESYDDFGRFRVEEAIEHPENLIKKNPDQPTLLSDIRDLYKTLPVNPTGFLDGTGDDTLDGEVKDAIDLTERLAKSRRVRQSIIRHAFRYFMGRNEFLSDSKTLMDAEQAYLDHEGSFDAVIVSLLTSDSFIYRKPP